MRSLAAIVLALGLPVFATAEPKSGGPMSILPYRPSYPTNLLPTPTPGHGSGPIFNSAVIPPECVKLSGRMGCSRQGLRICIYNNAKTGRKSGRRMGGICTPRSRLPQSRPMHVARDPDLLEGTYLPPDEADYEGDVNIPAVFARSPVESDSEGAMLAARATSSATKPPTSTSKPASSKTSPQSPTKTPKKQPPKDTTPITASACSSLKGRRLCYKGKQVCLYNDKSGKPKVKRVRGACKARPRRPQQPRPQPKKPQQQQQPWSPLYRPSSPFPQRPAAAQYYRPGQNTYGHGSQPGNSHRPWGYNRRRGTDDMPSTTELLSARDESSSSSNPWDSSTDSDSDSTASSTFSASTDLNARDLWGTTPECRALGGMTTCLAGRRTCRYMDKTTHKPRYAPMPGTCGGAAAAGGMNRPQIPHQRPLVPVHMPLFNSRPVKPAPFRPDGFQQQQQQPWRRPQLKARTPSVPEWGSAAADAEPEFES